MDNEEKKLREELSKNLGIELCSEEELATEQRVAEMETSLPKKEIKDDRPQITVSELIEKCNFAMCRMSNKNPHKLLLHMCASAMKQLSDRLYKLEQRVH